MNIDRDYARARLRELPKFAGLTDDELEAQVDNVLEGVAAFGFAEGDDIAPLEVLTLIPHVLDGYRADCVAERDRGDLGVAEWLVLDGLLATMQDLAARAALGDREALVQFGALVDHLAEGTAPW